MKKAYILTGDPIEIEKVIRENRVRTNRGKIKFSPIVPEAANDEKASAISDTKEVAITDNKKPKRTKKSV